MACCTPLIVAIPAALSFAMSCAEMPCSWRESTSMKNGSACLGVGVKRARIRSDIRRGTREGRSRVQRMRGSEAELD